MADLSDEQRELNRARQRRKLERREALDIAKSRAVGALDHLRASGAPAWFTPAQVSVYGEELRRLSDRIGESALARTCRQKQNRLARGRA